MARENGRRANNAQRLLGVDHFFALVALVGIRSTQALSRIIRAQCLLKCRMGGLEAEIQELSGAAGVRNM